MVSYDDVQKEVEGRDEFDIEVNIEFAHKEQKIDESEYLQLLCLIRIARGLNALANKK